jgi:hypothetical protein
MTDDISYGLSNLDHTIQEIKNKISEDPDPFLIDMLKQLTTIRENQQTTLVEKAEKREKISLKGGFRGYGVT